MVEKAQVNRGSGLETRLNQFSSDRITPQGQKR
jgi:hypothetical protein